MKNKQQNRLAVLSIAVVMLLAAFPFRAFAASYEMTTSDTGYARPTPGTYHVKTYTAPGKYEWTDAITAGNVNMMTVDGKTAYCIEPDKRHGNGFLKQDTSRYWEALTQIQKEGISYAIKFGYQKGFCNIEGYTGSSAKAQYAATQLIVWEFKEGVRNAINGGRQDVRDSKGRLMVAADTYYNAAKKNGTVLGCYNSLIEQIRKYYNGASFMKNNRADAASGPAVMEYDFDNKTWAVTLTDSNKCGVSCDDMQKALGGNIAVESKDDQYTFSSNLPVDTVTVAALKNYRTQATASRANMARIVWEPSGGSTAYQAAMSGSDVERVMFFAVKTQPVGHAALQKTVSDVGENEDVILKGFKFTFTDSDSGKVYEAVTDEDGKVNMTLPVGKYTVKENLTEEEKEQWQEPEEQIIEIKNNETAQFSFDNRRKTGTLIITKADAVTGETLEGAEFTVVDSEKNKIYSAVTDENGNTEPKQLPLGTYYYYESKAPDGYEISESDYTAEITRDGQQVNGRVVNDKKAPPPVTGDRSPLMGFGVTLLAAAGAAIYLAKKRTLKEKR